MRRTWLSVFASAAGLAWLGGCGPMMYFAGAERPTKLVSAEYSGLNDNRVLLLIRTWEVTDLEEPDFRFKLHHALVKAFKESKGGFGMTKDFPGVTFVSYDEVVRYQEKNYYWMDTPLADLGRALAADKVLYLEIYSYAPSRMDQANPMQGKLACSAQVVDVPTRQRAWNKPNIEVLYPPREAGLGITTNPEKTRRELLRLFTEKLLDYFRQHWEPIDAP